MVALECLPCIPAHMLNKALAGEELAKRIAQCLSNSSKEARISHTHTAAVACVVHSRSVQRRWTAYTAHQPTRLPRSSRQGLCEAHLAKLQLSSTA